MVKLNSKFNHSSKKSLSTTSSNMYDVIHILECRKSCLYLKLKSLYHVDDIPDDKSVDFIATYSKYCELSIIINLIKDAIF